MSLRNFDEQQHLQLWYHLLDPTTWHSNGHTHSLCICYLNLWRPQILNKFNLLHTIYIFGIWPANPKEYWIPPIFLFKFIEWLTQRWVPPMFLFNFIEWLTQRRGYAL